MHNAVIPTPPGSATAPSMDRIEAMRSATIPTPPATASLPQPPPLNNLEKMKIAVIPIPPSAATAPNTDRLEQMCNATIPQAPSAGIEMMDEQLQPPALTGGNVDHPHQSTSIEVVDGQTQPSMITGDAPTPDEHQALEQAGLATSDADDDFLHMLQTFKLQHGADFPPMHFPYNKQLDRHIMQNVQAGQYTVDMINLLEVLHHPHVGYSLQPYTRGPPYPSQQSAIEMAIVYLGCHIECVVIHLLGWYANLCLDMKELEHLILVTVSQESFSPILPACFHAYLWCQEDQAQFQAERLSMGDWIDEWMEEKVSAYMITVRELWLRTFGPTTLVVLGCSVVAFLIGMRIILKNRPSGLYLCCAMLCIVDTPSRAHFYAHLQWAPDVVSTRHEAWESCLALVRWVVVLALGYKMVPGSCDLVQ
ncbi:hypothetical protein F5141DRAFT_1063664 [Pisolithus sp. B1]|nr:hypothetical protein F5141DRAFT_1063664 [Pisolithus sp. B1]